MNRESAEWDSVLRKISCAFMYITLIGLAGCHEQEAMQTPSVDSVIGQPGWTDSERVRNADLEPGNWFTTGRTFGEDHYSPLTQINQSNLQSLGLAWEYDARSRRGRTPRGLEATPVVVDGIMYTSLAWSVVVALDAESGDEIWRYDPQVSGRSDRYACCDVVNRGVALWKKKVYVGTIDGFLDALDSRTGELLWRVDTVADRSRFYTITGAPRLAGDQVIIGNGGGEFGVRGYFSAYNAETGELAWRFYTVPGSPDKPYEHPEMELAAKTWDPNSNWEAGGGGTVWDSMVYDPELDLLYVGTGNSSPYPIWFRSPAGGDNLFLASILAINPKTGELVWYYQTTPGEIWDYTATQPMILADIDLQGTTRKVLMQAPKNGFFYVIDRKTGELLSANNYVYVNWASHIDLETGRPARLESGWYKEEPKLIYPAQTGGHTWMPMSYSPRTGLVYIPAIDTPMLFSSQSEFEYRQGSLNMGAAGIFPPIDSKYLGEQETPEIKEKLIAWDPKEQRAAWEVPYPNLWNGGVLSTASDLVIQGTASGRLNFYDAENGDLLHSIEVGTGIMAAPMSYSIGGVQYISVLAGYGGAMAKFFSEGIAALTRQNYGRLLTFSLGGEPVRLPPEVEDLGVPAPPELEDSTSEELAMGKELFGEYCARCHGGLWDDVKTNYPDVRKMNIETHQAFEEIVLGGILEYSGMASFSDVLSASDVTAIHHYLIGEQKRMYEVEQNE